MTPELLFEQASTLIRNNVSIRTSDEAWNIVRALQILINANNLESATIPLKIKIIIAMASCNLKIGNSDMAYNCAMIAKEKIDAYINSASSSIDFSKEEKNCDTIIELTKPKRMGSFRLDDNFVLNTINTTHLRKVFPPKDEVSFTRDDLYQLIQTMERAKNDVVSQAYSYNDFHFAERMGTIFNMYKYPLYYIWEKYLFGRSEEVWVEGESMVPYMIFASNIKENTDKLVWMLYNANPFEPFPAIAEPLYEILGDLQARLHLGRI